MAGLSQYRPEIDGLRAIAVAPVILFHAGVDLFAGGYVGVDVFFVISGYLITSFILAERATGTFSLSTFYARRVRRILPALFVVLAATWAAAWAIMTPADLAAFSRTLMANAAFVSNFLFAESAGYFEASTEETPLMHTWSLAVEEQFYVFFPLLLILLPNLSVRRLGALFAIATLVSFALAEWSARTDPEPSFYLPHLRAWELLAGALCACHQHERGQMRQGALALAGIALIAISVVAYDDRTPFPSFYTLAPVIGSALVVLFAGPGTLAARALTWPPFVLLGLISYSAYLWHFPLFAFARILTPHDLPYLFAGLIALTLALAWLTWRFVERPFRRIPLDKRNKQRLFAGALVGLAIFAAAGFYGSALWRAERIWRHGESERTQALYQLLAATPSFEGFGLFDDGACRFNGSDFTDAIRERLEACVAQHGPAAVVLGDSHAINLYDALARATTRPVLLGLTSGGCRPHRPDPTCQYEPFAAYLAAHPEKFERVVFTQAGYYLLQYPDGKPGRWSMFIEERLPVYDVQRRAAEAVADYVARLSQSTDVIWLGPRIEPHFDIRRVLQTGCEPGAITLRPNVVENFVRLDRKLATIAASRSAARLRYVSEIDIVRFDPARDITDCDALYWTDHNHWSQSGEARFGARLIEPLLGR